MEKFTDYRVVYADDINCHHNYASMKEHYGKEESFDTSSHGVGRRHSRMAAKEKFTVEQVIVDLKQQGVILGKRKKNDVAEECRFAYKDIDEVMARQKDMVEIVRKLHTVGVIKG